MTKRPGALVMLGDHLGSLCATRLLGRAGVDVTFADESMFSPAVRSRFVHRAVRSPNSADTEAYVSWLCEFGRRNSGLFLYPCNDDLAWILGHHRDVLDRYFRLYQPEGDAFFQLLDKNHLHAHATELGIGVPETHYPRDSADLDAIGPSIRLPAIVKPRTQMCFPSKHKGILCETWESLRISYRQFRDRFKHSDEILRKDPTISNPMIQTYIPNALDNIYTLAGIYDERTNAHVMVASKKLLQQQRLGVGVAFEGRDVRPDLAEAVLALCRKVNYSGIFEVEFIWNETTQRFELTDFNPRYYGQMGFEVARGLPLPLLAYHRACGDDQSFDDLMRATRQRVETGNSTRPKFVYGSLLSLLLWAQRASRRMTQAEYGHWKQWLEDPAEPPTDAVRCPNDPVPALITTVATTWNCVRHPRSFVRSFMSLRS